MLVLELAPDLVHVLDTDTGAEVVEPAAVALDHLEALPLRAGWDALTHDRVAWPLADLALSAVDPDRAPRRCLFRHLLREATARRSFWARLSRPAVTLVVPDGLPADALVVLRDDLRRAGARVPAGA